MKDQIITQNCLPILATMEEQSVDVVITDPPYPSPTGLFAQHLIDAIAALYLCAEKAKKHIVFFWTPLVDPPRPPPGWVHTATHIWHKPDGKTSITYEVIIAWTTTTIAYSKAYKRPGHKVWSIPILDYRTLKDWKQHPTQKPLKLLRYLVDDYTQEGDLILDPFCGTGTTLVAAQQLKRHYIGIETNPEYAEFARQRLQPSEEKSNDAPSGPSTESEQPRSKPRTKR